MGASQSTDTPDIDIGDDSIVAAASSSGTPSNEDGIIIRRTPIFNKHRYPSSVTAKNTQRFSYSIPYDCSLSIWRDAFEPRSDMENCEFPTNGFGWYDKEVQVRAERLIYPIEDMEHEFTVRKFKVPPQMEKLLAAVDYYVHDDLYTPCETTFCQAKSQNGYMEFCLEFSNPWNKYFSVAGFAMLSQPEDIEANITARIDVVVSTDVTITEYANGGCFGFIVLSGIEENIREAFLQLIDARFLQAAQYFTSAQSLSSVRHV